MKYSIIIVAYKAEDKLYKCLDSLASNVPSGSAEIIIVDNNETPFHLKSEYIYKLCKDQINGYCSVEVVQAGGNIGYAAGANLGATYATGRYLIFVNPDTIVFPGWAEDLVGVLDRVPEAGAVGPISNYVAGLQNWHFHIPYFENPKDSFEHAKKELDGTYTEVDMLIGFFLMTTKKAWDDVGGFDSDLFLGCDDLDYSLKLQDKGYKMLVAPGVFVYHFGHESFKANPKSTSLEKQTEEVFCKKLHEKYNGKVPSAVDLWGSPMINTDFEHSKVNLSISMIVRGLSKDLYDLVKTFDFADEIVIVYTHVNEIFKEALDLFMSDEYLMTKVKIKFYPWNDSFADARNFSLSQCTGDWVLWLDDDDKVPPESAELIRAILDKPGPYTKERYCHFSLRIKDFGINGVVYCDQPRLFPNLEGIRWKGRVHENYLDSVAEIKLIPVVIKNIEIHHTGYGNHELNIEKSKRNLRLLEMEPESQETLFHLGKQNHVLENFNEAIKYYEKAIEKTPESNKDGRDHLKYSIALCKYQDGSFIEESTLNYLNGNRKPDALFLIAEWFFMTGSYDIAKEAYEKYLNFGEITDIRGTHQESFQHHSKQRLEEIMINELAI